MDEYIKILREMSEDITWHLMHCQTGAINDKRYTKQDAVIELKKAQKILRDTLQEIEFQLPNPY